MKIGIVEICEVNHYTAVLALAETYALNPENAITVFILPSYETVFDFQTPISCISKPESYSVAEFLELIAASGFDRIHINTIYHHYKEFAQTNWRGEVIFSVHNTDIWFDNSISKRLETLSFEFKERFMSDLKKDLKLPLILFLKDFKRQHYRDVFIRKIQTKDYKILVYSESQKEFLLKYVAKEHILVFPFCIYTGFPDTSEENSKIRFCVPGSVSDKRREYSKLFDLLENNVSVFKDVIEVDLLGYIPESERYHLDRILSLKHVGYDIYFSERFISADEYDERLAKADVILGNIRVQVSANRRYGETKETGVLFNLIRAAKPGILPAAYPISGSTASVCLQYRSFEHLTEIIFTLIRNEAILADLKLRALQAAKDYSPEMLYNRLIEQTE